MCTVSTYQTESSSGEKFGTTTTRSTLCSCVVQSVLCVATKPSCGCLLRGEVDIDMRQALTLQKLRRHTQNSSCVTANLCFLAAAPGCVCVGARATHIVSTGMYLSDWSCRVDAYCSTVSDSLFRLVVGTKHSMTFVHSLFLSGGQLRLRLLCVSDSIILTHRPFLLCICHALCLHIARTADARTAVDSPELMRAMLSCCLRGAG
jgi:hypothetical protein